jgi:hypothetical protein
MYKIFRSAFLVAFLGASLSAMTIKFSTAAVGTTGGGETIFRFSYDLSGVSLLLNQELDVRFDPAVYSSLLNPVAPAALFDLLVLQPNNPPGAFGDYSLLALVNNPSTAGPFSVDATLVAGQALPSSQPFFINQIDSNGGFVSLIYNGLATNPVPEPGTLLMAGAGFIGVLLLRAAQKRPRQ